jgi:hypothetical protein
MRFDISDIQNCENVDDARNLADISPDAFQNLIRYAQRLHNEASLAMRQFAKADDNGTPMTPELERARVFFGCQFNATKHFFHICEKAKLLSTVTPRMSKKDMLELIYNL